MRSPVAALLLALPLLALAEPPGPSRLVPARRERIECGPAAAAAGAVLEQAAVTLRLDLEQAGRLQALVTGHEALRHPDLATLALALAWEQDLHLEGVTAARREALLDALLAPTFPESACLTRQAITRLRARLLFVSCVELLETRLPIARWAERPARPYLLFAERGGPAIPGDCGRALRRELGDASPAPADDALPPGGGSAIVPPPVDGAPPP